MEKSRKEWTCQTRRMRFLALALRVVVSLILFHTRPPESCFFTSSMTRVPQNAPIFILLLLLANRNAPQQLNWTDVCLGPRGMDLTGRAPSNLPYWLQMPKVLFFLGCFPKQFLIILFLSYIGCENRILYKLIKIKY